MSSKNCKHKVPCGCDDVGLTTPTACTTGTPECPTPDPCPETFCAGCVVYCGDSILDVGIDKGDRLDVIIQMMTLLFTNPNCILPVFTGAITGLTITTAGNGYTLSTAFPGTPLLGGSGIGAVGTVTTGGNGEIISVVVTTPGTGYLEGDLLIPDPGIVGAPSIAAAFTISILTCKSVLGLHSTSIASTTIQLAWLADPASVSYQVEYKLATAASWTLNPPLVPVTNPIDTIGNLLPDTDYNIRVNNICSGGACYSVTIIVRTKQ